MSVRTEVFAYNVTFGGAEYAVSREDGYMEAFKDSLWSWEDKRPGWDAMMNRVQKYTKNGADRRDVMIKINSLEGLHTKDEQQFKKMISEVISRGASIYSLKERVQFNKDYPEGVAANPEELEEAMAGLQKKWTEIARNKATQERINASLERARAGTLHSPSQPQVKRGGKIFKRDNEITI